MAGENSAEPVAAYWLISAAAWRREESTPRAEEDGEYAEEEISDLNAGRLAAAGRFDSGLGVEEFSFGIGEEKEVVGVGAGSGGQRPAVRRC